MNSVRNCSILLTNDDGKESPLLAALNASLIASGATVHAVIPDQEQSWIADAVTKFRKITATAFVLNEYPAIALSGTPSDCVNIGVFSLQLPKPDLVVSGINFGTNASLPLFLSSGTVGGATAGFLAGCRALAISVDVPTSVFQAWTDRDMKYLASLSDAWKRIATVSTVTITRLLKASAWDYADIFSINLPWESTVDTPWQLTTLENARFGALFDTIDTNQFKHNFKGVTAIGSQSKPSQIDTCTLDSGLISISPIRYHLISDSENISALSKALEID